MDFSLKIGHCHISFSVVEICEEHLPSFKAELNITIEHSSGSYTYSTSNIWFEYSEWDTFERNIRDYIYDKNNVVSLKDMSSYVVFKVFKIEHKTKLEITVFRPDTGRGDLLSSYNAFIDHESIFSLEDSILEFNKWW